MRLEVSLAPSGDLRLHFEKRSVDISNNEAGLRIIKRILFNAEEKVERPGHIRQFPTQHVVDAWMMKDKADRAQAERDAFAAEGIALDELDISL
jgi:hypothetical protein